MLTLNDVADHFTRELGNVVQVARYADPRLDLPDNGVDVFIPDCHILRPEDLALYPNCGFRQAEAFTAFLGSLHRLQTRDEQAGGRVRVWQVGDLFDEWRSQEHGSAGQRIAGIRNAHGLKEMFDLLLSPRPGGLGAEVLAGNHDFQLFALDDWRKARFRIVGDQGQMMVLHGDLFDWVERLPDQLQALIVQLARSFKPGEHQLFADTQQQAVDAVNAHVPRGDVPIRPGVTPLQVAAEKQAKNAAEDGFEATNVIDGDRMDTVFFKSAKELAAKVNGETQGRIRLMVMGHTHIARIARGVQADGSPFVLVDCGAWVDNCVLPGEHAAIRSAQCAVRRGNEIRILQIGVTPAHA